MTQKKKKGFRIIERIGYEFFSSLSFVTDFLANQSTLFSAPHRKDLTYFTHIIHITTLNKQQNKAIFLSSRVLSLNLLI